LVLTPFKHGGVKKKERGEGKGGGGNHKNLGSRK